jgi:sucrose-phosphate synthase
LLKESSGIHIVLVSLHGLIRAKNPELGRDADTGGQIKYVLELANELSLRPNVRRVDLVTRQIIDDSVGDEYKQLSEPISDKAQILRIPFGPKRYLRKEALWAYLDLFVDQMSNAFRRTGLPNLIHGHYADAGYAGAQLARMLHIPYVFTGHSLGRVKRMRMNAANQEPNDIEKRYRFATRVEAEELALEVASMVVASTHQEIEEQYELYQHYVPDRMEVIPPGVDLQQFRPPKEGEDFSSVERHLRPFLTDMSKPTIMAMARPDERKNLPKLIEVYGQSKRLQELANLVLVMGTREDLRGLPPAQRTIIQHVLHLIDLYNLYGKVAYPKHVTPNLGAILYRYVARSKGVFINSALTEPFGLTLLEAAASGVPIATTADGGPRDIVANCQNGTLFDPLDDAAIERALLIPLTESDQWQQWSENGLRGAMQQYSWANHVDRYLRDVGEIVTLEDKPVLAIGSRVARRLPEFDRLIVTDLDGTLTGDDSALAQFASLMHRESKVGFGIATGRSLEDAQRVIEPLGLPQPDVWLTGAGTELYYGSKITPDISWQKQIAYSWEREKVEQVLSDVPGLHRQDDSEQSPYKVSYIVDTNVAPSVSKVRKMLREAGLRTKVIISLDTFLDILPVRGGNGVALRHLLFKWGFSHEQVLVAGDSGVDEEMLRGGTLGVVVGNHGKELNKLRKQPRIYFARGHHASGVLEGIEHYQFTGAIAIAND